MSDTVLLAVADGVALLTLNRPDKLNALNYAMIDRLTAHLDRIEVDPDVRAVILTGAGDRAFSAGADINEFAQSVGKGAQTAVRDFVRRGQKMTARLEAFPKPVIAAVNGLAFGGGCEIVEAVHLGIASDQALFAKAEIKLAMQPTFGGTQRLPRLAGRKRALELLLTGDPFLPSRALELGLINTIVPHNRLLSAARELAARIIRHSPLAIGAIISAVTRGLNMAVGEGLEAESEQFARLVPTQDLGEGLAAWIERRAPIFAAPAGGELQAARAPESTHGSVTGCATSAPGGRS